MKAHYGREALELLKEGVDELVDAIKPTLGPTGRNVIYRSDRGPVVTNDGVTIASVLEVDGDIQSLGAEVVQIITRRTNEVAGDGTTTAAVLTQALLNEALKSRKDPLVLRAEINSALVVAEANLFKLQQKLSPAQMQSVARVAVGGDNALAKLISGAVRRCGKGVVTIEQSPKQNHYIEVIRGHVAGPLATRHFPLQPRKDIPVFIFKDQIQQAVAVIPVLEAALRDGHKDIAIIAPGFGTEVLGTFLDNAKREVINVVPITTSDPDTTAEALGAAAHREPHLEPYLIAKRVIPREGSTVIVTDNSGKTKVGVIYLYHSTELEFKEQAMRVEDAINAVRAAQELGVVPGGGQALVVASRDVPSKELALAMRAPYDQIIKNGRSGLIPDDVIDPLKVTLTALRNAVSAVGTLITTEVALERVNK